MKRLTLLCFLIRPYAGLAHFELYYNFVDQIHQHHNPLVVKVVHILNCILLFQAVHSAYMFLLGDHSHIQVIIHFQFEYLFLNRIWLEFLSLLAKLMVIYFNRGLFIETNFSLVELLYEILIKKESSFIQIRGVPQKGDTLKNVQTIQQSYFYTSNFFLSVLLPTGRFIDLRLVINLICILYFQLRIRNCVFVRLFQWREIFH